jgi:hypothetical protein
LCRIELFSGSSAGHIAKNFEDAGRCPWGRRREWGVWAGSTEAEPKSPLDVARTERFDGVELEASLQRNDALATE